MKFDPENLIVQLCAKGMSYEGEGKPAEAAAAFQEAWSKASGAFEKYIAAHYLARQQETPADKLKWDETALEFALQLKEEDAKGSYPSLYLNIAKGYEDLNELEKAKENYHLANSFAVYLPEDGYGNMIKAGIANGMKRVEERQ